MNMKITVSQLRKIIREEVEKTLSQHKKDGWPDCNEPGCTGKMKPNPQSGNKTSLYCSKCGAEKKKAIKLESRGFDDYVRDVDRDMPTSWDSPDPQDVHDEFLKLRDYDGEVPLKMLAAGLGVEPNKIDWNGTGLRVINGVVTELIGDPPYRTNR